MFRNRLFKAATVLALICATGCGRSADGPSGRKSLTVAVIPKGTGTEFWKSVHAGSLAAARELSSPGSAVEVIWKGRSERTTASSRFRSSRASSRRA